MKMPATKIIYGALGLLLFAACSNSTNMRDDLLFKNDFESVRGWNEASKLVKNPAHSGVYSCKTDAADPYSYAFKMKFKDLSNREIKRIHYKVWCYVDTLPVAGNVVVNIKSDTVDNVLWNGNPLANHIKEARKWTQIEGHLTLNTNRFNEPENELSLYLWNTGSSSVYIDDCEIKFDR